MSRARPPVPGAIRRRALLALALGLLGASGLLASLRGRGAAGAPPAIQVELRDQEFVPKQISAAAGATVEFHNADEELHSIVLVGHEDILDETFLDPGASHRLVLPADLAPGRYPLACTIHVDMRGELVVE